MTANVINKRVKNVVKAGTAPQGRITSFRLKGFKNHFYTDSASVKSGLRKRSTFDYPRALDSITE